MATRPLFQEFSDGKMSSILSPGMAKIFVVKPVIVKLFVVMAKTTGVNDYDCDDVAPPQKRAIGPFINWCCSPRNIFSILTFESHIRKLALRALISPKKYLISNKAVGSYI